MIQITKYAVPKKNNGTSSNNSGFANVTNNNTTVINGGDILVDSELSTTSTNAVQNAVITNAINQTISALTNTDNTISISRDGRTVTIGSNTWKLDDNNNLSYSGNIISSGATFENLTVTKAAHFFQLIIDEIKSTKGQILITAANAKLDKVVDNTNSYRCYWKTTDENKKIYNQFEVNDQAICQTFNTLLDGTTNIITDSEFSDLSNWSASNTYQPLNNSEVVVEDGEASFIAQSNTCYLAQTLSLLPSTEYTIKVEMKQDVESIGNVSMIFHSPIIDTTKPYFTNGDYFINNETLQGIDINAKSEYQSYFITFTTKETLPTQCNIEFVCTSVEASGATTYIKNVELVTAAKNKFYWRKVTSVGQELIDGETYNYVDLSKTDANTNSNGVPQVGDEIAQLGNSSNTDRQAAIIISAYNNQFLDPTIQAPSIVQYSGINDYNLSTHRLNVISKGLNSFKGNFTTTAGENLENKFMPYFPINAPFYLYDYTMEEPQATNPIRYNGYNDIYSTPTFLNAGKYKFRVFINSNSLSDSIEIASYGTTYPSTDLGNFSSLGLTSQLAQTDKTMKVDNATFYEYVATINITANGYFGLNYWEGYQIYIPENDEGFETNFSKIEQTNTRITSEVSNINGQISTINQTAENIEAKVDNVSVKIDSGQITLNGNTKVQGDLTISDATNGFTLTNDDNYNTIIKPQSIGEYSDYSNREQSEQIAMTSNNAVLTTPNSQSDHGQPDAQQYFEVTYNTNNYKYKLSANETLQLTGFENFSMLLNGFTAYNGFNYDSYLFSSGGSNPPNYTPNTTDYTPFLYIIGHYYGQINEHWDTLLRTHIYSIDTRLSIYNSSNTEVGYVTLTGNTPVLNYTFTASSTDTYEIRSSTKIRFNAMLNEDQNSSGKRRKMDYVFRDYVQTTYSIVVNRFLSSNEISNIIGYDGISLSLGNDNLIYMGKDSTNIKYGKNELLVDSTGIKKYAGLTTSQYQNESTIGTDTGLSYYKSEYAPLNGCVVRIISDGGDYYLQPRDEVIVLVNPQSSSNFYLGNPSQNIGRKVYMKIYQGRSDAYINVYTTPNSSLSAFVNSSGRGSVTSITVNDRGVMFISVGDRWLTYISY